VNDYESPELIEVVPGSMTFERQTVKKGTWGMRGVLVAATAAVGLGGFFAVNTALSEPAGPETPVAAVGQMFEALANEDMLGMTDVLLPSERESMIEPSLALFEELRRLEIVSVDADVADVEEIDIQIEGLELFATPITEGLMIVTPTAGTISASGTGELPFGIASPEAIEAWSEEPQSMVDEDVRIAVVEDNGSWYVSLHYSVAEQARLESGEAAPVLGAGPAPVGAETPEAALEQIIRKAAELDPTAVLGMVDLVEARAFYDYSCLYLPEMERGADELQESVNEQGVSWSIEGLAVSSKEVRGRTVATVDGVTFSATDGVDSVRVTLADGCLTYEMGDESDSLCSGEDMDLGASLGRLDLDELNTGVTVVQRDGRWYVSVVPTVIYGYRDLLALLEPSDIDSFFDEVATFNDLGPRFLFGQIGAGSSSTAEAFTAIESSVAESEESSEDWEPEEWEQEEREEDEWEEPASDDSVVPADASSYGQALDSWYYFDSSLLPADVVITWVVTDDRSVDVVTLSDETAVQALLAVVQTDEEWIEASSEGWPEGTSVFRRWESETILFNGNHILGHWDLESELARVVVAGFAN
jgi:hypothetical protein